MTLLDALGLTAFLLVCALWMAVIYGFATMCRCRRKHMTAFLSGILAAVVIYLLA